MTKRNILYFSNWSASEGITRSTVFPILRKLSEHPEIGQVFLVTAEQGPPLPTGFIPGVEHYTLRASGTSGFAKMIGLFRLSSRLARLAKEKKADVIWCRGATAAGYGVIAHRLSGIPLVVDSFEPHAQYMAETGTWRRAGLKYIVQRMLEKSVRKRALALLPVSEAYRHLMLSERVQPSGVFVFPCVVDADKFAFNEADRRAIRRKLGIAATDVVGIYTGKFGGLYYQEEAFRIFRAAFDYWKNRFHLIILTGEDYHKVLAWARKAGIPLGYLTVAHVDHDDVPKYLSAADLAFSTNKSVPALQYLSPIKYGEYWAAGLPMITTLLEGDDARIIREESGGYLLDVTATGSEPADEVFARVDREIRKGRSDHYVSLARKYRNFSLIDEAIAFVLDRLSRNE
ncbi:MAG: glycosyltransferase [Cyclobacteriaceae bacterium]|nr:glycosyltransferase [Cyclobacteriaceae bacterium]